MTFWGDIKKLTAESAKAIGTSIKCLSEVAEEANKVSERLLANVKIARLERELNALPEDTESDQVRAEKCDQLLRLYDELAALGGGISDTDISAGKDRVFQELNRQSVRKLLGLIESLEQSIAKSHFSLPVHEINPKRFLLGQIDALLVQLESGVQAGIAARFSARKKALLADITQLESLRSTEEVSCFPSGSQYSRIKKYDGKRHGHSEYWYESGGLKLQMNFAHGQICGPILSWRDDGSVLFEGNRLPYSNLELTGYLRNGTRVLHAELGLNSYCELWLAGVVHLGTLRIKDGRVRKLSFLIRLMFNFSFWCSFWRLYSAESCPKLMDETLQFGRQFERFANDLSLLAKGEDPEKASTEVGSTKTIMGLAS